MNNTQLEVKEFEQNIKSKSPIKSSISNSITSIMSRFSFEDVLLFGILFLLIQEEVEDDFLIMIIVLLILTE